MFLTQHSEPSYGLRQTGLLLGEWKEKYSSLSAVG